MMDTVRFFKEHAKAELRAARLVDSTTEPHTLQRMQHHVAVLAGYGSWGDLLAADDNDRQLAAVMTYVPSLTDIGIGGSSFARTSAERRESFRLGRNRLRGMPNQVAEVRAWLEGHITPIRTINPRAHSYMGKHLAEDAIGRYVSNGEFIAAAVIAGYPYRVERDGGPNAYFGMSNRDLRGARAARDRVLTPRLALR